MKHWIVCTGMALGLLAQTALAENFTGIGAMLSEAKDGGVQIRSLIKGGPAEKAGTIKKGDVFVAIEKTDGSTVDLSGLDVSGIAGHVRGPSGSAIVLHLKRGDKVVKVPITRGVVKSLAPKRPVKPEIGSVAPDISWIRLSDDKVEKVSDHKGKVVVIDFWATWCGPCQKPMAKMQTYAEQHPELADKAVFVACSVDRDRARLEKHLATKGWTKTHNVLDDDNENDAYGVTGIPTVAIVNTEGKIAALGHPSSMDIPKIVADLLKK